jgi:hypothetical protein
MNDAKTSGERAMAPQPIGAEILRAMQNRGAKSNPRDRSNSPIPPPPDIEAFEEYPENGQGVITWLVAALLGLSFVAGILVWGWL